MDFQDYISFSQLTKKPQSFFSFNFLLMFMQQIASKNISEDLDPRKIVTRWNGHKLAGGKKTFFFPKFCLCVQSLSFISVLCLFRFFFSTGKVKNKKVLNNSDSMGNLNANSGVEDDGLKWCPEWVNTSRSWRKLIPQPTVVYISFHQSPFQLLGKIKNLKTWWRWRSEDFYIFQPYFFPVPVYDVSNKIYFVARFSLDMLWPSSINKVNFDQIMSILWTKSNEMRCSTAENRWIFNMKSKGLGSFGKIL